MSVEEALARLAGGFGQSGGRECAEDEFIGGDGLIHCRTCGEARAFRRENPFRAGEMMEIPCMCRCRKEQEARLTEAERAKEARRKLYQLKRTSLMTGKLMGHTFETWRETAENSQIKLLCEGYCRNFEKARAKNKGLLFLGEPGTGKTFAAACIANRLIADGVPVAMTSFVNLVGGLEAEGLEKALACMDQADLLILDDLGAERGTETAIEKVYNIIDTRYRQGKPMILTTNLKMTEIENADIRRQRIYDRVRECCYPVQFVGESWRRKQARANERQWMREMMGE